MKKKKNPIIDFDEQIIEGKNHITINIQSEISEILKNINYEFILTLKEKKKNKKNL